MTTGILKIILLRYAAIFQIIGFLSVVLLGRSQNNSTGKVYQLSGVVISRQTGVPVPYVRIIVNHSRRGAVANHEGFYSVPVIETDTLYFSSVGYHPSKLIVKDYLTGYEGSKRGDYLYEFQYMVVDTVVLPTVTILPYQNPQELRTSLLNMPTQQSIYEQLAYANLDPAAMSYFMKNLPSDDQDRYMVARQRYMELQRDARLAPSLGMDFSAVYRLINYFHTQSTRKKEKIYNYWPDEASPNRKKEAEE